ncbi:MAG TPA: hypothetical protein VFM53_15085 [Anaeromyxobacteraceae bacterium]|nr:hypothetical protein [Anaeromyxobacteraceae bacterium]
MTAPSRFPGPLAGALRGLLAPALCFAAACAHAPDAGTGDARAPAAAAAPAPAPVPDDLSRIRADVETLLAAQAEATWTSWTTGAPLDAARPAQGREWLLDGSALRALDAQPPAADPAEAARRRMLRDFLVGERLAAAAGSGAEPPDLSFPYEGRVVALRDSASLLAAEPDAARREALDAARAPAALRASRAADASARALAEGAARAGLGDLPALAAGLRGESLDALAALAGATLDATGPAYCAVMDALSRSEVGVPIARSSSRDLPRILRAAHEPRAHPASRLVDDGRAAALAATGEPLEARVRLDARSAAAKSQRPLAVPVAVPGDVRISARPSGGASESRAFLHELGVALYLSSIRAPELEPRRLGTPAAPEVWGYLLEGLAADPAWLNERSGLAGHALAREIRASQADRLHAARMQAARLLREVERARGGEAGPAGDARVLSRTLCRTVGAEEAARWPLARDPLLGSADALRAALLAAQLEVRLAAEGNGPWWRWRGAATWLAGRWAPGSPESVAGLLRATGVDAVSPAALAQTSRSRFDAAGW